MTIPRKTVNRYIETGQLFAESAIEKEVIEAARQLNSFPDKRQKPTVRKLYKGKASRKRVAPLPTYVGIIKAQASKTAARKPIITTQRLIRKRNSPRLVYEDQPIWEACPEDQTCPRRAYSKCFCLCSRATQNVGCSRSVACGGNSPNHPCDGC
jgi:hypothetical protein